MLKNSEKNLRSIAKAASWRAVGTIDTFILSFLITGKLSYASAISFTEVITKIGLYYFHERIWNAIKWGKSMRSSFSEKSESIENNTAPAQHLTQR